MGLINIYEITFIKKWQEIKETFLFKTSKRTINAIKFSAVQVSLVIRGKVYKVL
jgi:hypothetical protein